MNKLFFSGRLCRDPEVNSTRNGKVVCNITLAQDTRAQAKSGEVPESREDGTPF